MHPRSVLQRFTELFDAGKSAKSSKKRKREAPGAMGLGFRV